MNQLKTKYLPKTIGLGINMLSLIAPTKAADIALDIFRTPRKGRIESYQKKFLKKFTHLTLKSEGMDVQTYDNEKDGTTVLLCHGWESNSYRWRKLYRELQKTDLRVVLMDAPGHGASGSNKFDGILYKNMIKAAVDHYQPQVIVGHSVGGYSALFYVGVHQPKCLEKLIILASPDKFTDITNRYFNMLGYSNRLRRTYMKRVKDMFGEPGDVFTMSEYAKSFTVPGLIIHDRDDRVNEYYEAEAIHKNWVGSELIPTVGLGHSLQGNEVYQTIIDYIA